MTTGKLFCSFCKRLHRQDNFIETQATEEFKKELVTELVKQFEIALKEEVGSQRFENKYDDYLTLLENQRKVDFLTLYNLFEKFGIVFKIKEVILFFIEYPEETRELCKLSPKISLYRLLQSNLYSETTKSFISWPVFFKHLCSLGDLAVMYCVEYDFWFSYSKIVVVVTADLTHFALVVRNNFNFIWKGLVFYSNKLFFKDLEKKLRINELKEVELNFPFYYAEDNLLKVYSLVKNLGKMENLKEQKKISFSKKEVEQIIKEKKTEYFN